MTTSHESPHIPDFEKDAQSIAAYEEARVRYERRESGDAESRTRAAFNKKREAIRAEIAVAATLLEDKRNKAQRAMAAFSARYPELVDRNKPLKPGFWQNLISLGTAGRAYNKAVNTANDAQQAQTLRRRKEHDEEELEQQLKRTLYLQEESVKKKLESPEGLAAFHARPGVSALFKRVEEIKAERAKYAARLERGEVPPEEQREREFTERKIVQLEVPFAGLMMIRVARYGNLTYFILRDLEKKLYRLSYDPRLENLVEGVLDVYRLADSYEVKLRRHTDGRAFTALDHFATNFKDEEVARSEYRRARTSLRAPRTDVPATPPVDDAERQLLDLLANFSRTIGPGAIAALNAPASAAPAPPMLDAVGKPADPG